MRQQLPADASLEGHRHGDTVSEQTALHLVCHPDFPYHWAILPSADGFTLTLIWADSSTLDELCRVKEWIRSQTAEHQAAVLPRGRA